MLREDIGYLFPNRFVIGMKLYKIVQSCRNFSHDVTLAESEIEIDDRASCVSNLSSWSVSCTSSKVGKRSSPSSSSDGLTMKIQKPTDDKVGFVVPEFLEDIQRLFLQDAIFTTPQRNKIIRECCRALQGYCRAQGIPITSELKRQAAKKLSDPCPNSLGVEVCILCQ